MPTVKALLLGDAGVGKTCIAHRFIANEFDDKTFATIGAASLAGTVKMKNNEVLTFNIWDTAGQERYRSLAPMYFNGAGIAFLVFDITKRSSFDTLDQFYSLLKQKAPENIVFVLVGNKSDLANVRDVDREEAEDYATKIDAKFYLETSALDGTNVHRLFERAAELEELPYEPEVGDFQVNITETSSGASAKKPNEKCC